MKKILNSKGYILLLLTVTILGCSDNGWTPEDDQSNANQEILIKTNSIINDSYLGNGAQWDPYPQAYRFWNTPISDNDWTKLTTRLDYMKPSLMRVVYGSYDKYAVNGPDTYEPQAFLEGLERILQYCQDNDITVMLGDWGFNFVDLNNKTIFEDRLKNVARYINFLVNDRGFTCIKHFSSVNEPNLSGSGVDGDYELWRDATLFLYSEMEALGVTNQVKLAGPDIAPFSLDITDWVSNTASDFGDKVSLYDIHTYPPREDMFDGDYEEFIRLYKNAAPAGTDIVIGEFGFKYDTGSSVMDQELNRRNLDAITSDPFKGLDSNALIGEYFHGVDIASMIMKIVNEGYSGAVTWNLDDAMHSNSEQGQDLKIWGFWNILGEELLGKPEEEQLRSHFYTYSLLTRYMPKGTKVFKVDIPQSIGLDAIGVEKDGKYMIAINNIHTEDQKLTLKFDSSIQLSGIKKFLYQENNLTVDTNGFPSPIEEGLNMDMGAGEEIILPKQSMILLTNFDY